MVKGLSDGRNLTDIFVVINNPPDIKQSSFKVASRHRAGFGKAIPEKDLCWALKWNCCSCGWLTDSHTNTVYKTTSAFRPSLHLYSWIEIHAHSTRVEVRFIQHYSWICGIITGFLSAGRLRFCTPTLNDAQNKINIVLYTIIWCITGSQQVSDKSKFL